MERQLFDFFVSVRNELYELYDYYDDSKHTAEPFNDKVSPYEMEKKLNGLKEKVLKFLRSIGFRHYREYRGCELESHDETVGIQDTYLIQDENQVQVLVSKAAQYYNSDGEFFNHSRKGFCICNTSVPNYIDICEYIIIPSPDMKRFEESIAAVLWHLSYAALKCQPKKIRATVREHILWAILNCNDVILGQSVEDYIEKIKLS